jgi:signal transduction histidine kinase
MQNVQNAAEIQQRVINLVEFYRTKVGKESQIAKDAKADHELCLQDSLLDIDMMDEEGLAVGLDMSGESPHTGVWIKHLMVNEQLLGHFYSEVAGETAEKEVLDQLLPDVYDTTIFTEEEETFLKAHFKEMVNYIILTPCDDNLEWVQRHDSKNAYTIPSEVLELIKTRVEIPAGSTIYYPQTFFAQLANLFEDCTYYCDTMFYAWTRIAIYANGIATDTLGDDCVPSSCDAVVSYLAEISDNSKTLAKIKESYQNMPIGGKLILLCPSELLWKKGTDKDNCSQEELRKQLVLENSIIEILQLPSVMSPNLDTRNWCLLIAEKGSGGRYATLIDARFAFKETKYSLTMDDLIGMGEDIANRHFTSTGTGRIVMTSGPFGTALDTNALKAMIDNNGILTKEGLRKMVHVDKSQLDADNLLPQIYVIERPSPEIESIPLDSICQLISRKVKSLDFDLPLDTPWIKEHNLSRLFHGALDIETLEKADCPNNPPHDSDYEFDKDGIFIENHFHYLIGLGNPKSRRVAQYRACTYLDGKSDAVIFSQDKNGVNTALYSSTNKPVVVGGGFASVKKIKVFSPSRGVDASILLAILRMPVVYRQIQAYEDFGLNNHLKDILVPWNELLISDEKNRLHAEEEAFKAQNEKFDEMKTEYINEVRMRKHDMGQKVFDLINTEDLMRYYVENRETESDLWLHVEEQLDHFRSTIHELSEMLDHLSQEEHFGTPELFDLNEYLANLQHSNNVGGYKLSYQLDRDSILDFQLSHSKERELKDINSVKARPTVFMAKNDLQRVVGNILSNAQKHGFIDCNREDYEVKIVLSFNSEKDMYQIDFRNNGQPLSEGLNKLRYGIKGEKAGETAGTGLGGSVVKSIVEHYKGDFDVFMDGNWTVVRIYLPLSI